MTVMLATNAIAADARPNALVGLVPSNGFPTPPAALIRPSILDLAKDAAIRTPQPLSYCDPTCIQLGGGSASIEGLAAADPDGRRVYLGVSHFNPVREGGIVELDVDSRTYGRVYNVPGLIGPLVAVHPMRPLLVMVGGEAPDRRAVFLDTDTFTIVANTAVPMDESDVYAGVPVFASDGAHVYVPSGNRLYKLDAADGHVVASVNAGFALRPRLDRVRPWIWGIDWEQGRLVAFDEVTLDRVAEIARDGLIYDLATAIDGSLRMAWTPDDDELGSRWLEALDAAGTALHAMREPDRPFFLQGGSSKYLYRPEISGMIERYADTFDVRQSWSFSGLTSSVLNYVAFLPEPALAVEFHHAGFDHYFLTSDANEIDALDRGAFAGWQRTGESFNVMLSDAGTGATYVPVCRFYGRPERGLDSHFYSASREECSALVTAFDGAWVRESEDAFYVVRPDASTGACPIGTQPVYRLWNARFDSNHRYTTSLAIRAGMLAKGYIAEGAGPDGVAFCARS